jgi:hypothetical protein
MSTRADGVMFFNGINGATGDYGLPPMTSAQLARVIRGEPMPENIDELRARKARAMETFGPPADVDPRELSQAGWGIIFPNEFDPAIKEALHLLMEKRKRDAGDLYRVFEGPDGYRTRAQESKSEFLERHGTGPGTQSPEKMPYYLLLVGSPEQIPYSFQRQLDVNYATGRIDFDALEEYTNYAQSVIEAEKAKERATPLRRRTVQLFGVTNADDPATDASTRKLIKPVADYLASVCADWQVEVTTGEQAQKESLARILGGDQTSGVLFTASHGMEFPAIDPRQRVHQGALLCGDWPGREKWGRQPIPHDFYFAGDDLEDSANLWGLIAFFFACYGGGTPRLNEFAKQAHQSERSVIAPRGFSAYLPQRMLAHPKGGALAVIAHVERAWGYSFLAGQDQNTGEDIAQTTVFNSVMKQLLDGYPVGAAVEFLNERYADISSDLSTLLEEIGYGRAVPDWRLASMWTANNDARNYVILGDPAVRIAVSTQKEDESERPTLELSSSPHRVPTSAPIPNVAAPTPESMTYGLFGGDKIGEARDNLEKSIQTVAQRISEVLKNIIENLSELEVKSYVSNQMSHASDDLANTADLRAYTSIKLDGDINVCIPKDEAGNVDTELWEMHLEMVKQAQSQRQETMRIAVEAVASLLKAL